MIWWVAPALAGEVVLGAGRAAVLAPTGAVTAVSIQRSAVAEVIASPPTLVVLGRTPGTTTLKVTVDGEERVYEVKVDPDRTVDPSGDDVRPVGPRLTAPVGTGALCKIDPVTTSIIRMEDGRGQVSEFGSQRFWIQAEREGPADVVFEHDRRAPTVLTLVGGEAGGDNPAFCRFPSETVEVPLGGQLELPLDRRLGAVLVGHPSLLEAEAGENRTLALRGLKAGLTTVLVRSGDTDEAWMRTVVVAPPG